MSDRSLHILALTFGKRMARSPLTRPRKAASQQRSRATVEALLEATARILIEEGFDRASTNRIADVAGVSVGSLYQYFPSKEALVAAVAERHRHQIAQTVQHELPEIMAQPVEQAIRSLVAVAVKAHQLDPALHRALAEQIPGIGELEGLELFNRENYAVFRRYLEGHKKALHLHDLELASYICVTSIEALAHNAVLHHSAAFSNEAMQRLIDEVARLVTGYVKGQPDTWSDKPKGR